MPRNVTGGLVLAKLWLEHCCCVSCLSIVNIYLSVSRARVYISLPSSFNRREIALYMHVLHIVSFEGEDWTIIFNFLLFFPIWIFLTRKVKVCSPWQCWLRKIDRWKLHPNIPKFDELIFGICNEVIAIIFRLNMSDTLRMSDEGTLIMIIVVHDSLVPHPNDSLVAPGQYNVGSLILILVTCIVESFLVSLV